MAKNVIINGVTYNSVSEVKMPLADDPSTMALFLDTDDATATAEDVKDGAIVYADGKRVEGTMPVNGAGGGVIAVKDGTVSISKGFYDGTGKVAIADTEKAKLIAQNIRSGVTILGVEGGMSATEGLKSQSKTVTPTKSQQVVQPDSGYNALATVTVEAIPSQYITTTDANATAEHIAKDKIAYVNGKKVVGTHTDPSISVTNGVLSIV